MQGKPVKDMSLFKITWPLVPAFTLDMILPIVDSFFLSRVSDAAAGSVGAVLPVIMTVTIALLVFTQAGISVASQYAGGERFEKADAANLATLSLGLIIGSIISVILYLVSGKIGLFLGLSTENNIYATDYLSVWGMFFVIKVIKNNLVQIIASKGFTHINLAGSVLMNLLNIGLNHVFYDGLFGAPRLGVQGVALATGISLAVNVVFSILILKLYLNFKMFNGASYVLVREVIKPIKRIALPSALEPTSFQLYQVAVTALVVALGSFALTARVYTQNLVIITVIVSVALGNGSQIVIAHLVGAREYEKADRQLHRALGFAAILSIAFTSVILVSAEFLLSQFTTNREVIELGRKLLFIEYIAGPARACNIIVNSALRCSGDARAPAITGTIMMWTIGIGTSYILAFSLGLGLWGIWIASAVDEGSRAVYCYTRWRRGHWKHFGIEH